MALALIAVGALGALAGYIGIRQGGAYLLRNEVAADTAYWTAFVRRSLPRLPEILKTGLVSPAELATLDAARESAQIVGYRIIGSDGMVFLASRDEDIGRQVSGGDFDARVRNGESVTTISVTDDASAGETVLGTSIVPVKQGPAFLGAIEVTVDRTQRLAEIRRLGTAAAGWLALLFCLGAAAVYAFARHTARERDSARDTLQRTERRLQNVMANVPGMVFQRRRSRRGRYSFPYVSEGVKDLLGLDARDVERDGSLLFRRILDEDRPGFERALEDSAANLQPFTHDFRAAHLDGTVKWLSTVSKPSREADGTVLWDAVCLDLTDRKSAEQACEAAMREAEAANRAKSEFLATVSHEVRTPMNGVLGISRVLLDTGLTEQQRDLVQTICQSGEAMLNIVNDVLDLSRLEGGGYEPELSEFRLGELIDGALHLFGPTADEKGLQLTASVAPDVPTTVLGDAGRVRQVLINVLGNAVKFTDQGSVSLSLSLAEAADEAVLVRFEVTDTGIGIAPEAQRRLFERFSQVGGTAQNNRDGSGLGLAISRKLCAVMGGEIGVDSEPGHGSTFWFTVQFGRAAAADSEPEASRIGRDTVGEAEADVAGPDVFRVLLVADDVVNRSACAAILSERGYLVDVAESGLEAIAAARGTSYDVILMDIRMLPMDGIAATQAIRCLNGRARQARIIAVTANALDGEEERFREAGADVVVSNPVDPESLTTAIERQRGHVRKAG